MPSDLITAVAFLAFGALVTAWLALPVRTRAATADDAPVEMERQAA